MPIAPPSSPDPLAPATRLTIQATGDADEAIRQFVLSLFADERVPEPPTYVAFPYGGLPASPDGFRFLSDPSRVDEAYAFAQLANAIPDWSEQGRWVFTDIQLSDEYVYWLDSFVPPPIALDPKEKKRLRTARAYCEKQFNRYWAYATTYQNARDDYEAWLNLPERERPPDYDKQLREAAGRCTNAEERWEIEGQRGEYERQYAIVQDLSRRDPALAKELLRESLGKPIHNGRGDEFYWTSILPMDAFTALTSWKRYVIEFQAATNRATQDREPTLALTARQTPGHPAKRLAQIPLGDARITFEMIRLVIDRSWFSSSLLTSRAWKWAASNRSDPSGGYALSDGSAMPRGHLVMIPRELLFIRNKVIESPGLRRSLSSERLASASTTLSFGPFGLRAVRNAGGVATDLVDARIPALLASDYAITDVGVEAPGMEYFAFICELLPMEPNPDWALWPRP